MTVQRMNEVIWHVAHKIADQRNSDDIMKFLDKCPRAELDHHKLVLETDEKLANVTTQALVVDEIDLLDAIETSMFDVLNTVANRAEFAKQLEWRVKQKSRIANLEES